MNFKLLPDFLQIIKLLVPHNEYSERVEVFRESVVSLNLPPLIPNWPDIFMADLKGNEFSRYADIFNDLVDTIRINWKLKYHAKFYVRQKEATEREIEYCRYADALHDQYARLVVIRLDLHYKREYANNITVHDAIRDLNRLYQNSRHNSIFKYRVGFIEKLEYGGNGKGIHIHAIYFFDGSKRNNPSHVYIAQQIGEYWVNTVTKGLGDYWNINDKAANYEKLGILGIGVINSQDTKLRHNLKQRVIAYLCKIDQFIRPRFGPGVKLICRGNFPKKSTIKRGRPRKCISD